MNPKTTSIMLMVIMITIMVSIAVKILVQPFEPGESIFQIIEYRDRDGVYQQLEDQSKPILVFIFNLECKICRLQLNIFETHADSLFLVSLYLLSTKEEFFTSQYQKTWQRLYNSDFVQFGVVNRQKLYKNFGYISTPTCLFLSSEQKFKGIYRGLLSWKDILQRITIMKDA